MIFWLMKVFIGYTVILLIWDIFIWMSKNRWEKAVSKRVEVVLSAPREKREKYLRSNYSLLKSLKFILWLDPFCLIMLTLLSYFSYIKETKEIVFYLIIILLLGYPISIHEYLLRKAIVTELESKMRSNSL